MTVEAHGLQLLPVITLLAVAVVAAPLFKRLGLGSVLGYLAGGIVIGPFGLRMFTEPASILQIAELGVVMFLFVIGLEMRPSRLWAMRKQIFGLGFAQVLACALLLTLVGVATGFPVAPSFVAGAGFVLTSTAIVMSLLEERGELASESGQRIVAILLLEDLMIVPLLALVAFLAPIAPGNAAEGGIHWTAIAVGAAAIGGLVVAGRYLLNPFFGFLANARAREVMTAAALLVVLGAAYAMELGGLSMAMGAFMAGVLLSESSYRHQLEVDVEPFRGILLGLFFVAVGMSLQLDVVAANWVMILGYVLAYMMVKALAIYAVARLFRSKHREAIDRALFMAQGGEFAFVLYAAAASAHIIDAEQNAILTAIIILSMVLTPLAIAVLNVVRRRAKPSIDGMPAPEGLTGAALVIGFGRMGQIASQYLFARGYEISIIDTDVEMVDVARELGFDVYYGDGTRLDILHAAGAAEARVVMVCVDKAGEGTRITELVKAEFPDTPVLARAVDRVHSIELIHAGVDVQVRETFESALVLGAAALERLGATQAEIVEITARIRERDQQRMQVELEAGLMAGRKLFNARFMRGEQGTDVARSDESDAEDSRPPE
ncbi:monovalent cation:proton antiporter-2 (CPA2) family protein [Lysobacter tyrosinilyticus]